MKTKLTLLITALWAVLVALHEGGLLDLLPFSENINKYIKFLIPLILTIGNAIFVKPSEVKSMLTTKKR